MRMRLIGLIIVVGFLWGCAGHSKPAADAPSSLPLAQNPGWDFGFEWNGDGAVKSSGTDAIGEYNQIARHMTIDNVPVTETVRSYADKSVVLFSLTYDQGAPKPVVAFPDFDQLPADFHVMSFKEKAHAPVAFDAEASGSPWLLFDDNDNAMVIAPASHFLIQRIGGDGKTRVRSELRPTVTDIPPGFTQQTLVSYASGINRAWDQFGDGLMRLTGKTMPANDGDLGLKYLGYWTDNGAYYYYNFDKDLGYDGTLLKLADHFREASIPVKYIQLDSWWYYKSFTGPDGKEGKPKNTKLPAGEWNRYGGLMEYRAHPGVLPDGLAAFQKKLGLPLITHNRWVDPASPYQQEYEISGFAGVDPRYWQDIIDYVNAAGVITYEQDWLSEIYLHSPELAKSPDAGDKFLGGMASATANRGMSMQYCMAMPQYYMQGSLYSNLTTIRTSDDRFKRDRWRDFLYASRFAESAGIWPWADVYMSVEKGNVLVSDLSGGMVGFGDEMGKENADNLFLAVRKDGVIVKPDAPIVPVDSAYIAEAKKDHRALVASTYTNRDGTRTEYVLAFRVPPPAPRKSASTKKSATSEPSERLSDVEVIKPPGADEAQLAMFSLADIGVTGAAYAYDFATGMVTRLAPSVPLVAPLGDQGYNYYVVAQPGESGIAFMGDMGKFVSNGKQRISGIHEDGKKLTATVVFAEGEKTVRLHGCCATPVSASVNGQALNVAYDEGSQHFWVDVDSAGAGSVDVVLETK